jgi:hypothetical protein
MNIMIQITEKIDLKTRKETRLSLSEGICHDARDRRKEKDSRTSKKDEKNQINVKSVGATAEELVDNENFGEDDFKL